MPSTPNTRHRRASAQLRGNEADAELSAHILRHTCLTASLPAPPSATSRTTSDTATPAPLAATVVHGLRRAVGSAGTVVVPAFTRQVADPCQQCTGVPDESVRDRRDAVPLFHPDLPASIGAIPEALRVLCEARRSPHPQASVSAIGANAVDITTGQDLGFALGRNSPFARMYDLAAHILLIGVGHNRNTFLHHVESLTPRPRLKLRRFPMQIRGERVWVETLDVGNDNDTYFPLLGHEFEQRAGISPVSVGNAGCRLAPAHELVDFAVPRLAELLATAAA